MIMHIVEYVNIAPTIDQHLKEMNIRTCMVCKIMTKILQIYVFWAAIHFQTLFGNKSKT